MTPQQFLVQHGPPKVTTIELSIGEVYVIPFDSRRYSLLVFVDSGNGVVLPTYSSLTTPSLFGHTGPFELFLSHDQHGSAVNLEWRIHAATNNVQAIVVEGYYNESYVPRNPAKPTRLSDTNQTPFGECFDIIGGIASPEP